MLKTTMEAFGGLDIVIANAGWTKFEKFGDLSAMTDEEWDKESTPLFIEKHTLILAVLENKRHGPSATREGGKAHLRCESRRRSVHRHVIRSGQFMIRTTS